MTPRLALLRGALLAAAVAAVFLVGGANWLQTAAIGLLLFGAWAIGFVEARTL